MKEALHPHDTSPKKDTPSVAFLLTERARQKSLPLPLSAILARRGKASLQKIKPLSLSRLSIETMQPIGKSGVLPPAFTPACACLRAHRAMANGAGGRCQVTPLQLLRIVLEVSIRVPLFAQYSEGENPHESGKGFSARSHHPRLPLQAPN